MREAGRPQRPEPPGRVAGRRDRPRGHAPRPPADAHHRLNGAARSARHRLRSHGPRPRTSRRSTRSSRPTTSGVWSPSSSTPTSPAPSAPRSSRSPAPTPSWSATTCVPARPELVERVRRRARPRPAPTWSRSGCARPTSSTSPPARLDVPGAMFTASHNPAGYNGIKLCRAGARSRSARDSGLAEIRDLVAAGATRTRRAARAPSPDRDLLAAYAGHLVGLAPVTGRRLKVVVDAGSGMAGLTVPAVAALLGRRRRSSWSRCTSSSTAVPAPRGQPDRPGQPGRPAGAGRRGGRRRRAGLRRRRRPLLPRRRARRRRAALDPHRPDRRARAGAATRARR